MIPCCITEYGAFAERLAIDQTSGNIYFTAVVLGGKGDDSFISVLSPRGEHLPLVSGLDMPRGIVLHPERG